VEVEAFRRLWLSAIAAALGQWMQSTALGWLALDLTDSEAFVGLVAFAAGLPFLVISIPGGLVIDRFDRRSVIIGCQVVAAVLATIVAIDVISGAVRPWHLPLAAFVNGSLQAILNPAQQSIIPSLVPRDRLTNAIGLLSAGQNMTRVVGPTIAGAVIGLTGTGQAFLLQAVAVSAALILMLTASFPQGLATRTTASLAALTEGARVVASRPDLRILLILVSIPTLLIFPYLSFMSVFARYVLDIGPQGLGLLMAASGVGAVIGALLVAAGSRAHTGRALVLQSMLYGSVIAGFCATRFLPLNLLFLAAAGLLGSSLMSATNALIQHRIDDAIRGRVFGIYMLTWGLMPLGSMPMGLLSAEFGAPLAVGSAAVLSTLLTGVLYLGSPALREI
jgi:MFS family permease